MDKISIKKVDTDIYFDNVSLLLPFDSNFNDNSKNNFSVTSYGNTQISSTQSKFGGASAYFDGAGDYIRTTISNWNVGVANESFTIEFWVYRLNTNTHVFLSKHGGVTAWNGTDGLQISFFIDSGNVLHFDYYTSGGSLYSTLTNNVSIPINQWVHIAATYDGTITKIFIDGIQQPTTSSTGYGTVTSASIVEIGGENGSFNLNGYIDDLRITKGIARYTSNFTPPKKLELAKIGNKLNIKKAIIQNGKLKISKSTYNPTALGDLKVWLDAKDLSTITKDGSNLVSQWSSKVGSINFTQANNSYKPTYQSAGTSAVNRDCLYFNAASSYGGSYNLLSSPSSNFTSIGATATLFAVARALYVGPYTNGTIIGQTNGSPYRRRLQMTSSTMFLQGINGDYKGGNNPNLGEVNHVNQPLVLVGIAIKSDGTARHYIQSAGTMVCSNGSFSAGSYNFNGTLNRGLIEVAGAASNANMLIGSAFGGGSENLKGEICEILIYNGTLSDYSFDQVIAGLKTKWTL